MRAAHTFEERGLQRGRFKIVLAVSLAREERRVHHFAFIRITAAANLLLHKYFQFLR